MEDMPRSPELPSARVTADLRRRLKSGEWHTDEALPAVADLASYYAASRTTVSRSLKTLESEGLVRIIPRWGTFKT
jgi:DNA-binding GntR family transcriptional regulator